MTVAFSAEERGRSSRWRAGAVNGIASYSLTQQGLAKVISPSQALLWRGGQLDDGGYQMVINGFP